MTLQIVLLLALIFFPVSEVVLSLVRRASPAAKVDDRGSTRLVWLVIVASTGLAIAASDYRPASLPLSAAVQNLLATSLLVVGLVLRWSAILTLGRFFTTNVASQEGQPVVTAGTYRFLRHPSYTGLLLAFIGLGVFFGNWLSIAVLLIPIALALVHRIRVEESVLASALGPDYIAYCARTKRLLPGVW